MRQLATSILVILPAHAENLGADPTAAVADTLGQGIL